MGAGYPEQIWHNNMGPPFGGKKKGNYAIRALGGGLVLPFQSIPKLNSDSVSAPVMTTIERLLEVSYCM